MDIVAYEIKYSNFQPSDDIKTLIYCNVEKILMTAPSDAFLRVSVKLQKELYKVDVKLCSKVKTIQRNIVSKNLLHSINEIQKSVAIALSEWRKQREFSNEALV